MDRRDRRDVPESAAPYTKEKQDLLARNRSGRWPRKKGGEEVRSQHLRRFGYAPTDPGTQVSVKNDKYM